ncbi:MAG: toll/interleukin-1 receptor domain-containing protein [Myxococcota bacterium]
MAREELIRVLREAPERLAEVAGGRVDLRGATLRGLALTGIDFRGADLRGVDWTGSSLLRCNFYGIEGAGSNFSQVDARGAVFTDSGLVDARFDGASLIGSSLVGSHLGNASFRGADLCICNLGNARLDRTDFTQAKVFDTAFDNLDLSGAMLVDLDYQGPCDVGYTTLVRTAQNADPGTQAMVETFLRGCGLDESGIEAFRRLVTEPAQWFNAFISYSHDDAAFAHRLYRWLQSRGVRCWLDQHELSAGAPLLDAVNRGVHLADKLLLCCSQPALSSWWVQDEVQKAIDDERRSGDRKIIPLDLDGHLHDWDHGLASAVRSRVAVDFRQWEQPGKFDAAGTMLLRALKPDA